MKRLRYPKFLYGVWARSALDGTWEFWNASASKAGAEEMRGIIHASRRNDACVVVPYFKGARVTDYCTVHGDVRHGKEAEELRAGVETLMEKSERTRGGGYAVNVVDLQRLLARVDARDSLAFVETKPRRVRRIGSSTNTKGK